MSADGRLVYGFYVFKIFLRADNTHLGSIPALHGLSLLWCTTLVWPSLFSLMVKLISESFAVTR